MRRRVRVLNYDDEMVYPYEIQYSAPQGYDYENTDSYGKPTHAAYYAQVEDYDTGELTDEYTVRVLKLFKYDNDLPVMYSLGPRDVEGVFIFEKDLIEDSDGNIYFVDYDQELCYYFLETREGERLNVLDFDLTTFLVVGDIYKHGKSLFGR